MCSIKNFFSIFKNSFQSCDLTFINPEKSLNQDLLKTSRRSDLLGNYNFDGVSYDGLQICVAGESAWASNIKRN